MTNSVQLHHTTSLMKSLQVEPELMRIGVSGNNYSDEMVIMHTSDALSGIDYRYDAQKMMGSDEAPQLYTIKGEKMMSIASINEIDSTTQIPVNIKVGAAGSYTLHFQNNLNTYSLYPVLRDNRTHKLSPITESSDFTFASSPGDAPELFTVLFSTKSVVAGDFTPEENRGKINVWNVGQLLNVVIPENEELVSIEIYNINGNKVKMITNTPSRYIDLHLPSSMYLVRVKTCRQVQTNKIVIF